MKKILIIDDDTVMSDQTRKVLEQANYSVFMARNRNEGVEMALTYNPDCIICDPILSGQDGYGVLQLMQKNNQLRNIPFVFLSSKAEKRISEDLQVDAADNNLPNKKEDLIQVIEYLLAKPLHMIHTASEQTNMRNNISVASTETETLEYQLVNIIEQTADTVIFRKKQIIYLDGNRSHHLYYIKKGKIKAFKNNEDGKELIVGIYGEGDFLGHVALLADAVHNHSTKAMDNSELLVISKQEFDSIILHNPHIIARFIPLLVKGLNEKDRQLLNVAYNSLRKKVAYTLLTVSEKYRTSNITLSRENLAAIAGTATASLIRMLSEFKDEKIIEINQNNITILSTSKLKQVVE